MNLRPIEELRETGQMTWNGDERLWMSSPGEVVDALSHPGFCECKREEARGLRCGRTRRDVGREPTLEEVSIASSSGEEAPACFDGNEVSRSR